MTTRLKIINEMLASTGISPVTSNDTMHPTYVQASAKLDLVSSKVQSKGWYFNRAIRTLKQNISGEIILPSTTLHVDPTDKTSRLTRRGTKLYDLDNATTVIGADTEVVFVEDVTLEDLPPQARTYIHALAVLEFYVDAEGVEPKLATYARNAGMALADLKAEHLRNADPNFFTGSSYSRFIRTGGGRRLPT